MPFSAVAAVLADPEGVIAEGSTGAGALVPDPEFPGRRRCLRKGLLAALAEEGQAALAVIPEAADLPGAEERAGVPADSEEWAALAVPPAALAEEGQAVLAAIPEAAVPLAAEEQEEDNFSESRNVLRVPAFLDLQFVFKIFPFF